MRYAIDRLKLGVEIEVCADAFYGKYIPSRKSRFFCPECGETVYWRSKGGNQPNQFYHKNKTDFSAECDKRLDGNSELYLYERIGLPVFITCRRSGQFQLNIGFPALGENLLECLDSVDTRNML